MSWRRCMRGGRRSKRAARLSFPRTREPSGLNNFDSPRTALGPRGCGDDKLQPAPNRSRSFLCCTFPVAVRGISSSPMNETERGRL